MGGGSGTHDCFIASSISTPSRFLKIPGSCGTKPIFTAATTLARRGSREIPALRSIRCFPSTRICNDPELLFRLFRANEPMTAFSKTTPTAVVVHLRASSLILYSWRPISFSTTTCLFRWRYHASHLELNAPSGAPRTKNFPTSLLFRTFHRKHGPRPHHGIERPTVKCPSPPRPNTLCLRSGHSGLDPQKNPSKPCWIPRHRHHL